MERFLFGFRQIYKQIAAFLTILVATILVIRALHPAFQLTYSPMMVIMAFFIMCLSLFVSWIIFSRFEQELARGQRDYQSGAEPRQQTAGVRGGIFHRGVEPEQEKAANRPYMYNPCGLDIYRDVIYQRKKLLERSAPGSTAKPPTLAFLCEAPSGCLFLIFCTKTSKCSSAPDVRSPDARAGRGEFLGHPDGRNSAARRNSAICIAARMGLAIS